ncbi:MAG: hypothetical protein RL410_1282 [Actinomycetota bacterium]
MTVLVVGDVMMDIIVSLREEMQRGSDANSEIATTFGGVGANVAAWIGKSGGNARLVSVVGNDPWGHLMSQHLKSLHVDVQLEHVDSVPTGIVVALAHPDGERSMFPDARANQLLSHSQFHDDVWRDVTWLSMSGYTLLQPSTRELGLHIMRMARSRGVKVALDPASSTPISAISSTERAAWFAEVDVLLPNEQELHTLAPATDWKISARTLAQSIPSIIVKRGAAGSAICTDDTIVDIPALATHVVDTVGAGDAYAAGTLQGLDSGLSLHDAALNGAKIATLALNTRGAQPAS